MTSTGKPRRQRRTVGGASERINIRVTPETKSALGRLAADAGMSLPNYLVTCALRPSGSALSGVALDELDLIARRLARIGPNLNQLAAKAQATGVLEVPALSVAVTFVDQTLRRLHTALDHRAVAE